MNRYLDLLPPSRHFCHVCDRNSHAIAMKASLKQQWIRRKRIIHGIAYQNSHDSHACHTMAYQVHLARSFDDTPAILLDTAEMSHVVHPLHLSSRLWQQQNGVWEKKSQHIDTQCKHWNKTYLIMGSTDCTKCKKWSVCPRKRYFEIWRSEIYHHSC